METADAHTGALTERFPSAAVPRAQRHGAALVDSDDGFLAGALPYLDEGLRAGDLVVLTCLPQTLDLLSRELGERVHRMEVDPRLSLLGARAPDAIEAATRMVARSAATANGRVRALADVAFGPGPAEWREGERFESVFNRLIGNAPMDCLCVYDRRRLPAAVLDSAALTHPALVDGPDWAPSPSYQPPDVFVPALPPPHEPLEDDRPVLALDEAGGPAQLRRRLAAVLEAWVPDRDQREDLHLAASEIAVNAFRHGLPPVSVRVWVDDERIVCTIADRGSYTAPFAGFLPAHGDDLGRGGMGLWIARKLFDSVDVLAAPAGTTVRLSARLR